MEIVRCVSCDGYGWLTDELSEETEDCNWCRGTGYVYRDSNGVDHIIPPEDYGKVSALLETLEHDRLHELGYSGTAKHPKDQAVRQGNDSDETGSEPEVN